jgi:hypothetical protein
MQENPYFMFLHFALSIRAVFLRFYAIFRWSPQKCKIWVLPHMESTL